MLAFLITYFFKNLTLFNSLRVWLLSISLKSFPINAYIWSDRVLQSDWVIVTVSFNYFSSYLFIAPNVVRPGREFSIQGELLVFPSSPVLLVAELKDGNSQVARTEVTVNSKQGRVIVIVTVTIDVKLIS